MYLGSSGEGSCVSPLVWAGLWAGLFSGLTSSLEPFAGGSSRQALTPSHCCAALRMARRRFSLMNTTHTHRGQRWFQVTILFSLRAQRGYTRLMEPLHLDVNIGKLIRFASLMSDIERYVVEDCGRAPNLPANVTFCLTEVSKVLYYS